MIAVRMKWKSNKIGVQMKGIRKNLKSVSQHRWRMFSFIETKRKKDIIMKK